MVKILVVEDEAITAMDIQKRLEELGYSVPATASSGEEAISLTEKFKPDLILMDIVLKGEMDGTEAAKQISNRFQTPLIFLTAYNDEDTFNRAKLCDPYGYMKKPFETRDLQNAIELALFKHDMITARRVAENELLYVSQHDMLTNLFNRSAFEKEIKREIEKLSQNNTSLAILLLDLDNFKAINDHFGHHVGDQLLIVIAKQLMENVRDKDFVARLGGDEFIIILNNIMDASEIDKMAKKLINIFNKPFKIEDHYFHATASIGIAVAPTFGKDEHVLMKNADIALYLVKELGRNNYRIFSDEINIHFKYHAQLESDLPTALYENQFFLVYQPQYSLPNKEVAGIEVLLRWQHPKLGLVLPDDFIPTAEKNGMIVPIGEWVLKHACTQFMEWQSQNVIPSHLKFAVNLSPLQLAKENFINSLLTILKDTGMSPKNLELELTESAVMTSAIDLDPILNQLQNIGIKISIDDFGMGYSSLSRLRTLPISTLKIDKSFINNLDNNSDGATIVKSIITLGNSLGLKVITEGVETQEQLDFLVKNNCTMVQGFYFEKKPLNAEDIPNLLKQNVNDF